MHQHLFELLVEIVKAGLLRLKDKVGLEAQHVVQESSEFVDFTADIDQGTGVFLDKAAVILEAGSELLCTLLVVVQVALLLQDVEKLGGFGRHLLLLLD